MPYNWTKSEPAQTAELHLWPHQSLRPRGYAAFILATFVMILIPLFPLLGSFAFWGLLPFLVLAVGGMWLALDRSHHNAQISEVLTLTKTHVHLVRRNPNGDIQEWDCNRYWARPEMHPTGGPVPHYVTLKGSGREVEIGAFLSEDERVALYDELLRELRN